MSPQDDDWVVELLASVDTPPMPPDVAERLDRTVRAHVEGGGAVVPPGTGPATDSAPPDAASAGADQAGDVDAASAGPVAAGPVSAAAPAPGSAPTGPVGAVPPPAPGADTGVVPVLAARDRAPDSPGGDPATATAGPDTTSVPGTAGRTPVPARSRGSFLSRREQREEQEGERRRALAGRWLPVAAGVLVLGTAVGVGISQLGGEDSLTAAEDAGGSDTAAAAPAPRALVATGTEYTTGDDAAFQGQVEQLVAVASSGSGSDAVELRSDEASDDAAGGAVAEAAPEEGGSAAAQDSAAAGDASAATGAAPAADPREGVAGSALADPEELRRCVDEVAGEGSPNAVAVDLATVDGLDSTVVVVPDAAGDGYLVYVVGPDCEAGTLREFYRLTP